MGLQDDLFLIGKITISGKQEGIDHLRKRVANLNKRLFVIFIAKL